MDVLALRTPTVPPATHTNCYRLGSVLIDPGSPWEEEHAVAVPWADGVDRIVLTHHHPDHIGGVAALSAALGAEVWAHCDARVPFPVHRRLEDDEEIDTGAGLLRCVWTPGHADGHLAFQRVGTSDIVVGDMLAGVGTIVLAPPEGHLGTYLASLARLRALGPSRLLPAHGPPLEDSYAAIDAYVAHRHARTAQVRAALGRGARTPEEVAARVYAGVPGVDVRLATAQAHAHIIWLEEHEPS